MKIKARTLPRDLVDILIGFPLGLLAGALSMGVPALIVAFSVSALAGAITFFLLYIASFLFMVQSLEIDNTGILFRRVLGEPKYLLKSEIVSIEEAPRREVIIHGWLWPIFPFSREMSACMSAKNHFRIRWQSGVYYFPPKDIEQFKNAVSENLGC
jgi:hypothetical protein